MFNKNKHHFFYALDCTAGRGLVNPLLHYLSKTSREEFEFYLPFVLEKCINVNQSFSDAVELFSIWIKKSPATLSVSRKY
ncbi:hypothetical protein BEV13_03985 [Rickettsiella grylli]|uniref:hypothetical protein n=1 Tax=Rickettsiella grylli TaxID=59196 RepID=UPI0008FD2E78|nr:hypothetical protein [Rickettsiella grylli]OJA00314.1 hypothetical protein BEV13_03985 [Rickettsiella grylli]